ncbi:hypothetical protein WJX72_009029 [[Myrmecia] bisecta]|uniref:Cytochrome P450 n=1 Tax=[Myrmecia] bisecta TaxID=41462 RepID=A0AAW1R8N0_9CHLO
MFGSRGKLPPGNMGIPYVGDTFPMLKDSALAVNKPKLAKYGPIFKVWLLGEKHIYVASQQSVIKVLNGEHDIVEGDWPKSVVELLGAQSVPCTYGSTHAALRKAVQPAFTPKAVASYVPDMVQMAETCGEKWAAQQDITAYDAVKEYTFVIILRIILGFDESLTSEAAIKRITQVFKDWTEGLFSIPLYLPGTAYYKALQGRRELLGLIQQNMDLLRAQVQKGEAGLQPGGRTTCGRMMLDATDEEGKPLTDTQLKDVFLSLMFAGHDTSASTIMCLFNELYKHPEVLQKLRDEQSSIRRERGDKIDDGALQDMKYADAVIKEMMRTIPVVKYVFRRAQRDFELEGYLIPKGWKLAVLIYNVLANDSRWQGVTGDLAADKFNPDRWLGEEGKRVGGHIPFGSGPRMCLGYILATAEIKVMLAVLARGFEWTVDNPNEELNVFPLPRYVDGLPMKLRKLAREG